MYSRYYEENGLADLASRGLLCVLTGLRLLPDRVWRRAGLLHVSSKEGVCLRVLWPSLNRLPRNGEKKPAGDQTRVIRT